MGKLTSFVLAIAGIAVLSMPAAAQTAPLKIGYINSQKLIEQAPGAAEVKTTLQKELASWKAQVDATDDSIKAMITQFQQKSVLLSPDAKQKQMDAITARQTAFQSRVQEIQTKAGERQQELLKPILDKIQVAIGEVRKAEGYAIIFDASTDAMVDADPALDLTDKVIAKLKAAPPATAVKN